MTTPVGDASKTPSVSLPKSSGRGDEDDGRQDAPSPSLVLAKISERVPTEKELAQEQYNLQLQMLARQLEYYFSKQNLSSDTYLQTLRGLNDGCVPVTILSNFAKVKAILGTKAGEPVGVQEEARMHAILQAVSEYTDLLQVHSIDTATGKIATDETPSSAITILAVGPVSEDSLPIVKRVPSVDSTVNSPTHSNTIILRDVGTAVTEEEVRGLLDGMDCPPVIGITSDVANCWFIAFDTPDRTELMNIMMQLRSKTYPSTGEYVMARLRASVVTSAPVDVYSTLPIAGDSVIVASGQPAKKKKKKKRPKRKKKKEASKKGATDMKKSGAVSSTEAKKSASLPPPSLTEDHFPSLQDEKVEWEVENSMQDEDSVDDESSEDSTKNGEEDEERKSGKGFSDGASTATTTSSTATMASTFDSVSKKQPVVGGYAAALLKAAPSNASVQVSEESAPSSAKTADAEKSSYENRTVEDSKVAPAPVVITSPPTWGGGRSFADTIRKADKQMLGGKLARKK